MKTMHWYWIWGAMFIVCAALGFLRQEQESPLPLREDPQPTRQARDESERAAAEMLSPERMRMFRGNQYFYVFRMLLLMQQHWLLVMRKKQPSS